MQEIDFDLNRARRDTPSCEKVLHFNNAGASLMPKMVLEAIIEHLELEGEIGGYEAFERRYDATERVYHAAATLLSCHHSEIAIIENATRAWDMAFYAIKFKPGDRILTSLVEYGSNYIAFLQIAKKIPISIEVIPNDESGQVCVNALQNMIDERVKLIAITHVPTNGGLVNPAAEIGKIARSANILYLLDVCQSIGQMPISVEEIGCDLLSATGRKYLRGPRATGLLYVRHSIMQELEPPFLDVRAAHWITPERYEMRADARRFENWETNYAAKIGLGIAIDYALSWGLDKIRNRISTVANYLRSKLKNIEGIELRDLGKVHCGIVSFTFADKDLTLIRRELTKRGINIWISPAESTRLDMNARGLDSLIRASVHYYNTVEEVDRFCEVLSTL